MSSGRSQQNAIIDMQNKQTAAQYELDLKNYLYQYGQQARRDEEGNLVKDENDEVIFDQTYDADGSKAGAIQDQYEYAQEGLELRKQADKETHEYQTETARQNWEQGKSMQQFQWDQEDRVYRKNIDQYNKQLDFNELEFADAIAREGVVLDEQFIGAAFENQSLIQDLYEATGTAGFSKAQATLGLQSKKTAAEYQKQKQLVNLKQNTKAADFRTGGEQLNILDRRGQAEFQKGNIRQGVAEREANRRFQLAGVLLDTKTRTQMTDYQNEIIRREQRKQSMDAAHQNQEATIRALQASGQAQLSQAGRSQGKAVQMVMAELGRNNAYLADTLVRGQETAEARMKQNKINNLNAIQKAALAEQQINFSTVQDINRSLMSINEVERGLKIGDAKSQLNLDEIKQAVMNNVENTTLDVENIYKNFQQAQNETGLTYKKIDFDLANVGTRFQNNQDILRANLQSAVRASEMNMKDIYRSKKSADLAAEARKMLDPSVGREDIDLDKFQPLDIPLPIYQDPMEPKIPPAPISGAMQSQMGMGAALPGAALTGLTMGLGTAAFAGSAAGSAMLGKMGITMGAGPLGLLVGLGSFGLSLF